MLLRNVSLKNVSLKNVLKMIFASHQCIVCCVRCQDMQPVCRSCMNTIIPVAPINCVVGSQKVPVFALGGYSGALLYLVHAKYRRDPQALWLLGEWMAELCGQNTQYDYLVPVPLHWYKRGTRWFNQAEELAGVMSKIVSIPVLNAVSRVSMRAPQMSLKTREERQKNVAGAFELIADCKGKSLLIIDDVYTTGATLQEMIRVVRKGSPASITVMVAARAL